VDVPELQFEGCPPVALAHVPSSGAIGWIFLTEVCLLRAWWRFDAGACAIFLRGTLFF